jgi:hypothetical protein
MSQAQALPTWIKVVLGIQLVLAALFFLLMWSHTVSLAQGRAASWQDLTALALPLLLVVAAWIVAARRRDAAGVLAILPWPLALVAYRLLGAV